MASNNVRLSTAKPWRPTSIQAAPGDDGAPARPDPSPSNSKPIPLPRRARPEAPQLPLAQVVGLGQPQVPLEPAGPCPPPAQQIVFTANTLQHCNLQSGPIREPGQRGAYDWTCTGSAMFAEKTLKITPGVELNIGLGILKRWQAIFEILERCVTIVFALLILCFSAVVLSKINDNLGYAEDDEEEVERQSLVLASRGICGFLIFIAIIAIVLGSLAISARFITSKSIPLKFFHIANIVAGVILAVLFFIGLITAASLSARWRRPPEFCNYYSDDDLDCEARRLGNFTGLIAFIEVFMVGTLIFLVVWSVYAIYSKWDEEKSEAKQTPTENGMQQPS